MILRSCIIRIHMLSLIPPFRRPSALQGIQLRGVCCQSAGGGGDHAHKPYYRYTPKLFSELLSRMFCLKELLDNSSREGLEDGFFPETPKKSILQRLYILSGSCFSARSFTVHRNGFSLKKSAFPTAVNCEIIQKEETGFL